VVPGGPEGERLPDPGRAASARTRRRTAPTCSQNRTLLGGCWLFSACPGQRAPPVAENPGGVFGSAALAVALGE